VLIGSLVGTPDSVGLSGTSVTGNHYVLKVLTGAFDTSQPMTQIPDTNWVEDEHGRLIPWTYPVHAIYGQRAYGLDLGSPKPRKEIREFEVTINFLKIRVPWEAFRTLFEPTLIHARLPIRAYESEDGQLLHIYIFGSDGAGAYMAKLVFNPERYLSTIAFQGDIGFACEF
jgi:hypothetical protein